VDCGEGANPLQEEVRRVPILQVRFNKAMEQLADERKRMFWRRDTRTRVRTRQLEDGRREAMALRWLARDASSPKRRVAQKGEREEAEERRIRA